MNKTVSECIRLMDEGKQISLSFKCFESIATAKETGLIPLPRIDEKHIGNHAVGLCGYSIEQELFKFANSWGKDWGDNGFGYLPFDYFNDDLIIELYQFGFAQ